MLIIGLFIILEIWSSCIHPLTPWFTDLGNIYGAPDFLVHGCAAYPMTSAFHGPGNVGLWHALFFSWGVKAFPSVLCLNCMYAWSKAVPIPLYTLKYSLLCIYYI